MACDLHRTQVRKGTRIPYVAHLLGVASIALEHGADEDEAIAAVLHDAVEDQGGATTATLIREHFGARVADIVVACSDTDVVPKPPWKERKERYIAHVESASASVRLVSASDKLHNARAILADYRDIGEGLWERFTGGRDGTLWYYRSLVSAFAKHEQSRLVEELDRVVGELETTARDVAQAKPEPARKDCKWCSNAARRDDDFCSDECMRNQLVEWTEPWDT
jgi:(p)ppGpp synthase/HD superfamily hydrolase